MVCPNLRAVSSGHVLVPEDIAESSTSMKKIDMQVKLKKTASKDVAMQIR